MLSYIGCDKCPKNEMLGDIITIKDYISLIENLMAAPTDRQFAIKAVIGSKILIIQAYLE